MTAVGFLLFVVLVIYSVAKRRNAEKGPSVIDARLRATRVPEATNVTAGNLGISVPPKKGDWSEYDVPTVLRRRRTTTS